MQSHYAVGVLWLAIGALLATAGCGSGEEDQQPPAAAIHGTADSQSAAKTRSTAEKTDQSTVDLQHPVVVVQTSLGDITVRLDAEKAPRTVDNFLAYVRDEYYDQTVFHRVIDNYVILGGTYTPELAKKETRRPIYNEAHQALKNRRGTIAMAREPDVTDSATSQFFFNVIDNPPLDHKDRSATGYGYCAFGEVTKGLEVVERISDVEVQDTEEFDRTPVKTVLIKSIRVVR